MFFKGVSVLPYVILLTLVVISYSLSKFIQSNNKLGSGFFGFLSLLMLVLFAALRSKYVGTDSREYIATWENFTTNFSDLSLFSEPLFQVLYSLTRTLAELLDLDFWLFFATISTIVCYLYLTSIEKLSEYKVQSFIVFFLVGFYTFHFNGARQAIAIAIFLYSYHFIESGDIKKFLTCVVIGFFIHKSIIIVLPFYYFFRTNLSIKTVSLIVAGTVLLAISIESVVGFAASYDKRYSAYAASEFAGGGFVTVLFYTSLLVWLWISMKINGITSRLYDNALLSMLVAVCIGWLSITLSLNPSGILRLITYFTQFSILAVPLSVMAFPTGLQRTLIGMALYLTLSVYFYLTTSNFSGLTPYITTIEPFL